MNNEAIITARAYFYEFLAYAFFWSEDEAAFKKWQEQARFLAAGDTDESADFSAILGSGFKDFKAEQNALLFDLSYANVPLCASFYDEGRDSGAKRMKVIEILKNTKYRPYELKEGEDFVGFLFLLMAQFLRDEKNGDEVAKTSANRLFCEVINDFIDELCELVVAHKDANIFKSLASIICVFMSLEREIYSIKAPAKKATSIAKTAMARKPHVSKMPTAKSKLNWDEFTSL